MPKSENGEGVVMEIKNEKITKKTQSSKKRHSNEYKEEGRSRAQRNLYELRNSEKHIKKTMQRLIDSEISELEDMDDLYEMQYVVSRK